MVCYIRKYVIILGGIFPLTSPHPKYWGCVPGITGGVDASESVRSREEIAERTVRPEPRDSH